MRDDAVWEQDDLLRLDGSSAGTRIGGHHGAHRRDSGLVRLYVPITRWACRCKQNASHLVYLHQVLAAMGPSCHTAHRPEVVRFASSTLILFSELAQDHFGVGPIRTALKVNLLHFGGVEACCSD